jgi:hypothetical protein
VRLATSKLSGGAPARWLVGLALAAVLFPPASRAQIVSVDELISLLKAGVSEEVVLYKVREGPQGLYLTSEDMVRLRQAGASDKFLLEVLKATGETSVSPGDGPAADPTVVTLLVYTEPAGAQVILDGVPVGTTPFVGNQLEPGQHELYVSKRFYRPISRAFKAKLGDRVELNESLMLELPGISVDVKTSGLPDSSRWAVRGRNECPSMPYIPVARDGSDEGRVVLRSQAGGQLLAGRTCLDLYFWMHAPGPGAGGEAPPPDVVFPLEDVELQPTRLTALDLVVERDERSPTGLSCRISNGPGRLTRSWGDAL